MMEAFITGSHAYGLPNERSDVDLVVMIDYDDARRLADLPGAECTGKDRYGVPTIRFGNLNLICCCDDDKYHAWREGTRELISKAPVSREDAVRTLIRHGV